MNSYAATLRNIEISKFLIYYYAQLRRVDAAAIFRMKATNFASLRSFVRSLVSGLAHGDGAKVVHRR